MITGGGGPEVNKGIGSDLVVAGIIWWHLGKKYSIPTGVAIL